MLTCPSFLENTTRSSALPRRLPRLGPLLLAVLSVAFGVIARAQSNAVHVSQLAHTAWRLREGAVPGPPNAVAQTGDGYIWVGTENGLYRFDGASYQIIEPPEGHIIRVGSLLADRDGSLWVSANNHELYHLRDHTLQRIQTEHKVQQMFQAPSGDLWFATKTKTVAGLCHVHEDVMTCTPPVEAALRGFFVVGDGAGGFWTGDYKEVQHRNATGEPDAKRAKLPWVGHLNTLATDGHGKVWAGVHREGQVPELFEHNSEGWHVFPPLQGIRTSSDIQTVFLDREGAMWVGTSDSGLYRLIGTKVDRFDQSDGLSANDVIDVTQDKEGSIWVATSGGVDQFHRSLVDSWSMREGLSGDSVSAVVIDPAGRVWMSNTGGLDVLENGEIRSYRPGHGLPGAEVMGMAVDHAGRLWVGIDKGVWILDRGKFQRVTGADGKDLGPEVFMAEDSEGQMWMRGIDLSRYSHGHVQKIDCDFSQDITVLKADKAHGMWIGHRGGPVFRVEADATKIVVPKRQEKKASFRAFYQTANQNLSETQFSVSIAGKEDSAVLDQNNGLQYEALITSAIANNGDLFLMTESKYLQISSHDLAEWLKDSHVHVPSRALDVRDGAIAGNATFSPTSGVAPNGDIWFATDRFPQRIEPGRLGAHPIVPQMHIESISSNGTDLGSPANFSLQPASNELEIHYAALTYISPSKVRYRYLLENFDTDWQEAGARREVIYSHLPPGNYRFRVMASDGDGAWETETSVAEFHLLPHFYQTTWFKVLLCAVALFALWLVYLARLRYLIRRTKGQLFERMSERERIARDLHDTFFQGIQGLLLRFQTGTSSLPATEPIRPMFEDLLKQSDQVMHEGRELVLDLRVRFADDEDLAQAFARVCSELQPVSPAKYNVIVQGKPKPLESEVNEEVFRIGKEAITNAFLHSGASLIEVEVSFEDRNFRLRVRDDGRGIEPAIHEAGGRAGHFGLTGMRERARKIGAELEVWSQDQAGTEIEMSLPLALASHSRSRPFAWLMQLRDKQI